MSLPSVGDVLGGKYEIVRLLGEGGMGAVYEAENKLTHKRVAIKWLRPELAPGGDAAARLLREAQAASRIRHSNVVDVYDVEREAGSIFLVMELLDGETLTRTLARRDLPTHALIALILPAMRGVAAAHRQGVIHRDVKPDNIFLAREDDHALPVPKVVDFGISKLEERGRAQPSLTRTGSTLGTPLYMSYEQLSGDRTIDGRADVYAFGVILYEALTGRVPFDAESLPKLVVKIATQLAVPPRELRPDIPVSLSRLVMRALARQREERTPSMDALIKELEPFATEAGFQAELMRRDLAASELRMPTPYTPEAGFLAQVTQPDTALAELSAKQSPRDAVEDAASGAAQNASAGQKRPYPFLGRTQQKQRFAPLELSPSVELGAQHVVMPTPLRSTPARLRAHGRRPRAQWLTLVGLAASAALVGSYRWLDQQHHEPAAATSTVEASVVGAPGAERAPRTPAPPSLIGTRSSALGADDWAADRPVQALVGDPLNVLDASPPLAPAPNVTPRAGIAKVEKQRPVRGQSALGSARTVGTHTQSADAGLNAASTPLVSTSAVIPAPVSSAGSAGASEPAKPTAEAQPADEAPLFRVAPPRSQEF